MGKRVRLAPLADHIVSRTPPRSYRNKDHLWMVLADRNASKLGNQPVVIDMLARMVEKRLIERDGAAFSEVAE